MVACYCCSSWRWWWSDSLWAFSQGYDCTHCHVVPSKCCCGDFSLQSHRHDLQKLTTVLVDMYCWVTSLHNIFLSNHVPCHETAGLKSVSGGQSVKRPDCGFAKLVFNVSKSAKEVCPYPWAISPQKWLQDDTYLTLALLFLLIRVLCFLLPIVASAWKQH